MTKRQREILEAMAAHRNDVRGELVYERGIAYLGLKRVAARTVFALLRLCAISLDSGCDVGRYELYRINGTGLYLIGRGEKPEGSIDYETISRFSKTVSK